MIWQVSQFVRPKIVTKSGCYLLFIRILSGCGHPKSRWQSGLQAITGSEKAEEGANYVPFSAKLQTKLPKQVFWLFANRQIESKCTKNAKKALIL